MVRLSIVLDVITILLDVVIIFVLVKGWRR